MMPNEFRAAVNAPDADKCTVVVEGEREVVPMKFEQARARGLVTSIRLIANPTYAWRLFVPDLRARRLVRRMSVPAREFRWGP